jgi:hypothetical protein
LLVVAAILLAIPVDGVAHLIGCAPDAAQIDLAADDCATDCADACAHHRCSPFCSHCHCCASAVATTAPDVRALPDLGLPIATVVWAPIRAAPWRSLSPELRPPIA